MALALLTAFSGALLTAQEPTPEEQMLALLNQHRTANGQAPLLLDPSLAASAEWKAQDMGEYNYFHHSPDSQGRDPWQLMCSFGYCWNTWKGENVGGGYCCAADVQAAWAASAPHNANMLSSNYRVAGLGHANVPGSTFTMYWVQHFGGYVVPASPTPAPACPDWYPDGFINTTDVLAYKAPLTSGEYVAEMDLNGDGLLNTTDILLMRPWFGTACNRAGQAFGWE